MQSSEAVLKFESRPKLRRGVRLVHNQTQGGWVLLAPEKIFKTDPIGAEILKRCDGTMAFGKIIEDLVVAFSAPPEQIREDVTELLNTLAGKRLLDF